MKFLTELTTDRRARLGLPIVSFHLRKVFLKNFPKTLEQNIRPTGTKIRLFCAP